MKILVNETARLIILNEGRIQLRPKGQPGDRKDVEDSVLELPDVKRFLDKKLVSALSPEGAAKQDAAEARAAAAPAPTPAPAPVKKKEPEKKEEPAPEPEKKEEEVPAATGGPKPPKKKKG